MRYLVIAAAFGLGACGSKSGELAAEAAPTASAEAAPAPVDDGVFRLRWNIELDDSEDTPRSRVTLVRKPGGETYELGALQGACSFEEPQPGTGVSSRLICWWAGGGTQIDVRREGGEVLIERSTLEEGHPGEPAAPPDTEVVHRIPVAADREVMVENASG